MRSRFRRRRRRRLTSRRRHFKRRAFRRTRFRRRRFRGRRSGAISKLLKHLLPTVPLYYCRTENLTGSYSARTWYCFDVAGALTSLAGFYNFVPNLESVYADHLGTSSIHLSTDHFNSLKFKTKEVKRYSVQNISNVEAYVTLYVMRFRKDTPTEIYSGATNAYTSLLDDAVIGGNYQTSSSSSVPAGPSYIGAIYNYPAFTIFGSSKTCSLMKVTRVKKLRVGPGETFHFRYATRMKEFSNAYIKRNAAATNKVQYVGNWSTVAWMSWHGPVCQKAGDPTSQVLAACDFLAYSSNTLVYKAVPTHTPVKVYYPPAGMITASPLAFTPVVRPKGVIQITETTANVEEKG